MTTLHIHGNVRLVLEGNVTNESMKEVPFPSFHFALGSGADSTPMHLGETIVIAKRPFVSWMEKEIFHTGSPHPLKSPFLMGISEQKPEKNWQNQTPISMDALYQELSKKHPIGFALFGMGQFLEFHSTHLKKAPIYHENINEKAKDYWANLPVQKEKTVCFFGVVIGVDGRKQFPKQTLDLAFYQNPGEGSGSDLLSHTHAAIIGEKRDVAKLQALSVQIVHHALTQSVLGNIALSIFPISKIEQV